MSEHVMATVIDRQPLNATVWQYTLKPDYFVTYEPGQYLQIQRGEGGSFFSIANDSFQSETYILHVRHLRDALKNTRLINDLALEQRLLLCLPLGRCVLRALDADKPIIFLAAGTGFAPIRAMIQQLQRQKDSRPFELYWSVTTGQDFYDEKTIHAWQKTLAHFYYCPHISQLSQSSLITRVFNRHPEDLKEWQIVMAGPFELMYSMRNTLLQAGLGARTLFSDAFEFEE